LTVVKDPVQITVNGTNVYTVVDNNGNYFTLATSTPLDVGAVVSPNIGEITPTSAPGAITGTTTGQTATDGPTLPSYSNYCFTSITTNRWFNWIRHR